MFKSLFIHTKYANPNEIKKVIIILEVKIHLIISGRVVIKYAIATKTLVTNETKEAPKAPYLGIINKFTPKFIIVANITTCIRTFCLLDVVSIKAQVSRENRVKIIKENTLRIGTASL